MAPILTVIVCTYNRSDWLRGCLRSLEPQSSHETVEVLVIDNNSTDDTAAVVREFSGRRPNLRYVFEANQGLSHARNRGLKEAQGQIVAYIDDDAKANSEWVLAIILFFEATPDASGVSGSYDAFSTIPIPSWFPKEYGRWSLGDQTRRMKAGEWINGTNMAFRRQALLELGGFDTSLGMNGNKVAYGEETRLMREMLNRGMHVYYCAEMRVDHAILPHKLKLSWLFKSSYASGYDGVKTHGYSRGATGYLPVLAKQMVLSFFSLFFCKDRYLKTRLYRSLSPLLYHTGFLVRLMGL